MSDKIIASVQEQTQKLVAPVVKLNKLNVANVEKLAALELATLREFSDLGVAQLKAAVEVKDAEGAKSFVESQGEYVRKVNEKLVADAKAVIELAKAYSADVQQLTQETVDTVVVKAA